MCLKNFFHSGQKLCQIFNFFFLWPTDCSKVALNMPFQHVKRNETVTYWGSVWLSPLSFLSHQPAVFCFSLVHLQRCDCVGFRALSVLFPGALGPLEASRLLWQRQVPESITLTRLRVPGWMTRCAGPLGQIWQDVTIKRQPCCWGGGGKQMGEQGSGDDLGMAETQDVTEEWEQ